MLDYYFYLVIHAQLLQQVTNRLNHIFIHFLGVQKDAINRKHKGIKSGTKNRMNGSVIPS